MSVTLKIVELVDRFKLTHYFIESNNKVHLRLLEFDPQKVEVLLDKVIKSKGKAYQASDFELNCIRELENV